MPLAIIQNLYDNLTNKDSITIMTGEKYDQNLTVLAIDHITNLQESWTSQVTSSPVEDGANIADNIPDTPEILSFEAGFTETNLSVLDTISGGGSAIDELDKFCKSLRENRNPCTIILNGKTYLSMGCSSYTKRNQFPTDRVLLGMTFSHLRIVSTDTVDISSLASGKKTGLGSKAGDLGKRAANSVNTDTSSKLQSIAYKLLGGVF